MLRAVLTAAAIALVPAAGAHARITELRIEAVTPVAGGHAFGDVGAYVRLSGVAKGELDPASPLNAMIVGLGAAPRNVRGLVEYETDIIILRPADPAKGSGVLLYDVTSAGQPRLWSALQDAPAGTAAWAENASLDAIGNGFALLRGYTLVWSGWEAQRRPGAASGALGIRLPAATESGAPMVRRIRDEFVFGTRRPVADVAHLSFPAAVRDRSKGRLTVRGGATGARREIPATRWEFVDAQSIRLLPPGTAFAPLDVYEFWYPATGAQVDGIGFAATRDLVADLRSSRFDLPTAPDPRELGAFLRNERPDRGGGVGGRGGAGDRFGRNGALQYALALGVGQGGRYLRAFLELGMNKDEDGRPVFDGMLTHAAGIGKVFANAPFAQPWRSATAHEDRDYPENWFPFSSATSTDPVSGKTAAVHEGNLTDPVLIESNTASEYWQKGASLLQTDPAATRDLRLQPRVRSYLIASAASGDPARPVTAGAAAACANPPNPLRAAPVLRALVAALEEWVTDGVEPPPNRVPQLAAGTAVDVASWRMPAVRGLTQPAAPNSVSAPVDWIDPPLRTGSGAPPRYPIRVPAVDADGNDVAGIRVPPVAVPLGTFTGWNVYERLPGELCDRAGTYLPFAKSKAEREAAGDPRPSLEERYGSRAVYVARVRTAADGLMRDRLLLPEDAEAYVRAAAAADRF